MKTVIFRKHERLADEKFQRLRGDPRELMKPPDVIQGRLISLSFFCTVTTIINVSSPDILEISFAGTTCSLLKHKC